jgi:redox-sensitive bicupin YhaK (pirin superfamily)
MVSAGGVQWMTGAASCIRNAAAGKRPDAGFQLWLNLPAKDKMSAPTYRDIPATEIPTFSEAGIRVKVIAGEHRGVVGGPQHVTEPVLLDLGAGTPRAPCRCRRSTTFVYVYDGGEGRPSWCRGARRPDGILTTDATVDGVVLEAVAPSRMLLLAGARSASRSFSTGHS